MHQNQALWKKFYSLASRIHTLKPWQWMHEDDTFVIRVPSGRTYFMSIMGAGGEFPGIIAYEGPEAFHDFLDLQDYDDILPPEAILTIPHMMLYWSEKKELMPEEKSLMKEVRFSASGKNGWPRLDRTVPGFVPALPEDSFLEEMVIALEQTLNVAARAEAEENLLWPGDPEAGNYLLCECIEKKGVLTWYDKEYALPEKIQIAPAEPDSDMVRSLAKLQEKKMILQMDLRMLPAPVKDGVHTPYFPWIIMLVEKKRGMVLHFKLLTPLPDLQHMLSTLQVCLLESLRAANCRPQTLEVRNPLLAYHLEPVNNRIPFGLRFVESMKSLDEAFDSLISSMEQTNPW